MFAWMSVNTITPELLRDIITKFSGHERMVERVDKFENGYCGMHGWCENVCDVLISIVIVNGVLNFKILCCKKSFLVDRPERMN